jgi:glycosyltransferase involved in cell wall biosynthesis
MRVLQLGPYSLPHGGIQAHVVALRRYLQSQGVPCDIIDLNERRQTDGNGVYGPRTAVNLFWLLLQLPADIVHLHIGGNITSRLLGLSLICGWLPGRKSVLTFHSGGYPSSEEGKRAAPNTLRGRILSKFDRVIGVNQEIVDVFLRYGLPPRNVRLIKPYSLPANPPNVSLPDPLDSFFREHSPVLISVGLLEPEYDLPLQIDVLELVRREYPNAGSVLIGSGSLEHELRKKIDEKPYRNDILLCGDVDREITLRAMADSDVYLRTTLFDGDSISLREALHFGVRVIASDRASRPDNVAIIPAEDIEALRKSILEQLRHEPPKRENGRVADDSNLEAVLSLYREMLQG